MATPPTRSRRAGHLSDKWGRRPLLLLGIGSCFVLLGVFGLCTTLWLAIANRLLEGLLNSNIPVAKVRYSRRGVRVAQATPSRHAARPGLPIGHHAGPGAPGCRLRVHGRRLRVRALPAGPRATASPPPTRGSPPQVCARRRLGGFGLARRRHAARPRPGIRRPVLRSRVRAPPAPLPLRDAEPRPPVLDLIAGPAPAPPPMRAQGPSSRRVCVYGGPASGVASVEQAHEGQGGPVR